MLLSQMKTNQAAQITEISDSLKLKRRLCDIGFSCGQEIVKTNTGVFSSPIAYTIRGTKLALRKKDAQLIGVII